MFANRKLLRIARLLENSICTPAFCSVARREGQASTSASASYLSSLRACAGTTRSECMPGSTLYSTVEAGRARLPAQHDLQSKRLLCSIGRAAEVCIKESTAASQKLPKALHAYQQRRSAFGLPNLNGDTSKHYQERRLIGYSPKQLYDVVAAVEHYKEFVPWCQRSEIIQERPPDFVEAELEVGFKLFVERYTSQVHLHRPGKVVSHVYDSTLFDHLDSTWEFKPGPTPGSTWLFFSVDFAFKSPLYRHIASVFFDEVVKHMMGAFEGRCKHLYGSSAFAKRAPAAQKMQTA
ncbi:hypothetical protein COCSUDRAFT_28720 [Coccomyxa subellipsoidea C-169]|uniref:Coenzyme Q-binding protein COQ10 START domain-containing protein n=1 Tax=Coccomyxa subellipsoidea (strain C-169) TaxID=574566 RepID=I0Z0V0_COCSC|nr:hypothetical protein COCSUDRAFT_28720 [Coccomyxa subellipsoidea C-169]EIE24269.1 hypothetical protein COCSUDRAFT_28720 [Coccomyxa subellipsoidea C-169]|eukprot:XP_005648813.1 hypothetical protein COCSUDRAFT_28720 [Coccomyxa subellipsoidea C-169]